MENQQVAYDIFKKLAYKKFKNVPLYLEWAPVNVMDRNVVDVMESSAKSKDGPKAKKLKKLGYAVDDVNSEDEKEDKMEVDNNVEQATKEEDDNKEKSNNQTNNDESDTDKSRSYKILVRNVPFEATVKDVKQLFSAFGDLQFVRLPKKLHGTGSHRGFAFVEFINKSDARKAFDSLSQSTHLYGRRLVLEWSKNEQNSSNDF